MQNNIVLTTAEDIVAVVDSILAKHQLCTESFIAEFTDLTDEQVKNALIMGIELGLIDKRDDNNTYYSNSMLASLLITSSNDLHKASIMRIILEQYPPYIDFKSRFMFTNSVDLASRQIQAIFNMTTNSRDIKNTIISLSTYSKSIISEGANLYSLNEKNFDYIDLLDEIFLIKSSNESFLQKLLGEVVYRYIDKDTIFKPLADAYCKIQNIDSDPHSTIVYAGNAFESFLCQYAKENNISLINKTGIISKADALNSIINKKHKGMIAYIGQIRNAANHGADPEESGMNWIISKETACIYPIVVATTIRNIVEYNKEHLLLV